MEKYLPNFENLCSKKYIFNVLIFLLIYIPFRHLSNRYQEIRFVSDNSALPILIPSSPIKQKIYFMYLPYFDPLLGYQRSLLQNCDRINESKYLIMGINSYFRDNGYLSLKWDITYRDLIFSKKIIMMSEEDIKINFKSFNFAFSNHIQTVIGPNSKKDLEVFFNTPYVFTHLIFFQYIENHKTSYSEFIKRKFYIQTAISNIYYCVNSNRVEYLKACMKFFGKKKIANFGSLFKNQFIKKDKLIDPLPPKAYFGFAMENSINDYWITEKLFLTYKNDVIPIYRGSVKNREILKSYGVNLNAFVDASNMSVPELVKYLNKLIKERGKKKLYEIYSQPLIPDKRFFDQQIRKNMQNILDYLDRF